MRIPEDVWRAREAAHVARATVLTRGHLERRSRGQVHPVEDFLWDYYPFKPAALRRWHPGVGVMLENGARSTAGEEASPPRKSWRFYEEIGPDVRVDAGEFMAKRGNTAAFVKRLLRASLERPARFGCFGLHEWAMVYRQDPEQIRHQHLPLRLPRKDVDDVVDSHSLACTHVDAFRFFTPQAAPLNARQLTRETQVADEQPGCLHAGMDLYKWAGKLGPVVPSELFLDAFELARDIREVDMQASPYDVTGYRGASGAVLEPIPIETPEGKREYVMRQREFTQRANALRRELLEVLSRLP